MSTKTWNPTEIVGPNLTVRVWAHGDLVTLEATETGEPEDGEFSIGHVTPGQAVQLSRALVKAAAEALGTAV